MKWISLAFFLPAFLAFSTPVHATTMYVPDDHATIHGAIDVATHGDTIIVRPGTYFGYLHFWGKAITVRSEAGPEVTIIDSGNECRGVSFRHGEGRDSVLEGFTIQNCRPYGVANGGGIFCQYSSPTIRNCVITNCTPNPWDLQAPDFAAGGGVACNGGGSPLLIGCTIKDNYGLWQGGGVFASLASPMLVNCIVTGNVAENGGAIYCQGGPLTIINCTFDGNYANMHANGIDCCLGPLYMTNTIAWDLDNYVGWTTASVVQYCAINHGSEYSWFDPVTCTDEDPLLDGNYELQPGSPCIDTGTNDVDIGWYDRDGTWRFCDATGAPGWDGRITHLFEEPDGSMTIVWKQGRIDMGAQEYPVDTTAEVFRVEVSADLVGWTAAFFGTKGHWTDSGAAALDRRFYRVVIPQRYPRRNRGSAMRDGWRSLDRPARASGPRVGAQRARGR